MPFCSYSCHLTVRLVPLKGLSVCLSLKQSSWSSIVMIPTHHWWSDLLSVNFWWIVSPYELTLSMSDGVHTSIEMTEYPGQHSEVMVYVYVWLKLCCKTGTDNTVIDKWPQQTRYTWTERVHMLSPVAIFVRRPTSWCALRSDFKRDVEAELHVLCRKGFLLAEWDICGHCWDWQYQYITVYDLNLDNIRWPTLWVLTTREGSHIGDYTESLAGLCNSPWLIGHHFLLLETKLVISWCDQLTCLWERIGC